MSALVASVPTLDGYSGRVGDIEFQNVIDAADTVADMVSVCFSAIVANPFLCVMVAASLIGVGIYKFVQLRRAAH